MPRLSQSRAPRGMAPWLATLVAVSGLAAGCVSSAVQISVESAAAPTQQDSISARRIPAPASEHQAELLDKAAAERDGLRRLLKTMQPKPAPLPQ